VASIGLGTWTMVVDRPVTLLELSTPTAPEPWLYALYGGLAASGLGAAARGGAAPRWVGLGIGALGALALLFRTAAGFAEDGRIDGDALTPILVAAFIPLALLGGVDTEASRDSRLLYSAFGLACTLLFGFLAPEAAAMLWSLAIPAGWACYLVMLAALGYRGDPRRWERWALAAAALGLLCFSYLGFEGVTSPLAAAALAAIPVFALWVSGTRALLARSR